MHSTSKQGSYVPAFDPELLHLWVEADVVRPRVAAARFKEFLTIEALMYSVPAALYCNSQLFGSFQARLLLSSPGSCSYTH